MAEPRQPVVSLMDRMNDDPELLAIQDEADLATPNGMSSASDIMPDGIEIELDEEGGATIDFDPMADNMTDEGDFYRNLAEDMDDDELGRISNDLVGQYDANRASRQDWEDTYTKGLDLLGFKYEERTMPFRGATGVTHPLLAETATQFQAQAFNELLPPEGPVRTTVVGAPDKEKESQARRVQEFMNYYITNVMEEYTPEFDQMLFYLPLAGSTFKKVYYDETLGRAVSSFVPAENLVVPYETSNLETAPIITHVVPISANDLRKKQVYGFYLDVPINPGQEGSSQLNDEIDDIQGVHPSYINYDCTLLEFHVELDLPGFEDMGEDGEETGIKIPYIVTISEESGKVLAIRRNYIEDDESYKKIQYFVHYKFLPGLGFYGLGLIHTIGGLSRTATAALRQLIDAGTLSNLPAGFKARGMRIRDDSEPLQPGEFRDVDAPGGAIRESLMPLPFKGPDQTLFNLLGFVVEAGQRFATITNLKVGDGNQNAPVGTTVAMLEQGTRVMSAVHKRMHYALRQELKLLTQVIANDLPQEYPYSVEGGDQAIMAQDFDDRVDVVPVSNPNVFSQSQRIAVAQSQLELAMQAPQLHNTHEAYRRMYEALGVRNIDKILNAPTADEPLPKDPAQEHIDAMDDVELKAFEGQDHDAHITAHLTFMASGVVQAMPAMAMALQKHVLEHVKLKAREQAAAMFLQQNQGQEVTEDQMLDVETLIAQIIAQEMQTLRQMSQSIMGGEGQGPDPLLALKEKELQIKEQGTAADISEGQRKLDLQAATLQERSRQFNERLASQEETSERRIEATNQRELMRIQAQREQQRGN